MTTPMRRQYLAIKKRFPDTIVFFRLGDFYETFDQDAEIVAEVCDVVLTSRPVGKDQRVPLAGVPYHSVEPYIAQLVAAGYKVAIAEQEGNKPPPGQKLVERRVSRVVTAGTIVDPGMLEEDRNNYLVALIREPDATGLAFADITTGEFAATQLGGVGVERRVQEELDRLQPAEVLLPDRTRRNQHSTDAAGAVAAATPPFGVDGRWSVSHVPAWQFEKETAERALLDQFQIQTLAAFGCEDKPLAARAAGALVQYLRATQRDALPHLQHLRVYSTSEFMILDEATRRNLELVQTIRGGSKKGSLLGVLDRTRTPMGSRLLRRWLNQPVLDLAQLNARLDAVEGWQSNTLALAKLRGLLRQLGDLERWTNRAAQGIARPQELAGIRQVLLLAPELQRLQETMEDAPGHKSTQDEREEAPRGLEAERVGADPVLQGRESAWGDANDVLDLLQSSLADELPATLQAGGVIRRGFSAELDGIAVAARDGKHWVAGLERSERERTGIKSLKVGFNKVFGYYIEVTKANSHLVPEEYVRKQTLVSAERYITSELKEVESLILNAEERQLELESQIYRHVLMQVGSAAPRLLQLAHAIAELDVHSTLAEVAANNRYARPQLADDGIIEIKAGRHPVVESSSASGLALDEPFQPNDVHLAPDSCIIILTGPNMSGKSTYLRQVALIVLLAQIGSFVPADSAHIGLVDRIFTRIGAQDEIHAGQSTFMVEMVEAANILNHATARSLIIFDELGRGTSTYDGLSIAWAVVEYIHNHPRLKAKTLFATHYHELTELAERLPHVINYNVAVAEEGDKVVFLHKILPGAADRSYGIHVAQLAGLPRPVIHRAEELLQDLEAQGSAPGALSSVLPERPVQLTLFGGPHPVSEALKKLDINALSPLEALNKLYELKQLAKE